MQPPAHLPCHLHHFFRTIGKHGTHVESDIAERPEELECEGGKRHKHVLNGATMVPLVVTTFGKLGPSALGFLQSLAHVVSSTAVVDCGTWLRIAQQYLSFALVRGCGIVFRYFYQTTRFARALRALLTFCD